MKNCYLLLACLLCSVSLAFSQQTLTGTLIDGNSNNALQYATVKLLNPSDSSMVAGSVTDELGAFTINAPAGSYLFEGSYIGYTSRTTPVELTDNVDLGEVSLLQDQTQLEEVEITAQKSQTTFELDKKVFNVGQDITSVGTDAIDVLSNVPSVTTDIDGNVSLRGSGGVLILINGQQSGLINSGDPNALKNIPASLIERVEVITNPSARYDAEGQVGIINIVLKKQQQGGLNGSFNLDGGTPERYGASVNLNYRKNNVNLFTRLGGRYRSRPRDGFTYYDYFAPLDDGITYQENTTDSHRSGVGGSGTIGVEYFLKETQYLTAQFDYEKGKDENESLVTYDDYLSGRDLYRTSQRLDNEDENEEELEYSLRYNYDIDSLGKKVMAQVQFEQSDETELNDFEETLLFGNGFTPVQQIAENHEGQKEYLFQLDYILPFSSDAKMEFGAKSTLRDIDTDFEVQELVNGEYVTLEEQTNQFLYDEDIHALYAMYGNEAGALGYQLGLRGEYSDINTQLLQDNEENPRDYFQLFPSAFLTYRTDNGNAMQASYSRRINRPGFWELNPFLSFTNPRRIWRGNENLNPEYTNSFELGYLKEWELSTLNTTVYHRHTTDIIRRITEPIAADAVQVIPRNLDTRDATGFEFLYNSDLTKWLTVDLNTNFFYFTEDGGNINQQYEAEGFSWFARGTTRLRLPKNINGQLRFFYRGPSNTTQGEEQAIYSLDAGLSKEIFDGQGTISVNGRNLLNSLRGQDEIITDTFYSESEFQWRPPSAGFGFSYRFNQNGRERRQQNGGEGEDFEGGEDGGF